MKECKNQKNLKNLSPLKNTKKWGRSFGMALCLTSALVTPLHAMMNDWPSLFNPKKPHYHRVLGSHILEKLDERSLGRAAQVGRDWRGLVYALRKKRLSLEKSDLYSLILDVTQAEPNEVQRFHDVLEQARDGGDGFAKGLWDLKKRIVQPESLIRANDVLLKDLLTISKLTDEHTALKPLSALIKDLCDVLALETADKSLREVTLALKAHYETYLSQLLSPGCNRSLHIHPKALLSGEGFLGTREGFTSHRISQEMARDLLSRDEYGLILKKNVSGAHAVCFKPSQLDSRCGVHFKGDTAKSPLMVGREAAVYALSQVLFQRGAAASALLSLHNVDIKTPPETSIAYKSFEEARQRGQTSGDFFTLFPAYEKQFTKREPSHVVQASHHVEGLSLEALIRERENSLQAYQDLDLDSFSAQILLSILTNPTDGKPDNFMLKRGLGKNPSLFLVGIDNDMALEVGDVVAEDIRSPFIPGQKITRTKKRSVRVKNSLYCLPLMNEPLSSFMVKKILSFDPDLVTSHWLQLLKEQKKSYEDLLITRLCSDNPDEPSQTYLSETQYKSLHLPFTLDPDFIPELSQTLRNIQIYLQDHPSATHWQLLLNSRPLSARFYQAIIQESNKLNTSILDTYLEIHPQPDPLGKPPKAVPYLEDLLSLEEKITNDQTIGQILHQITRRPDGERLMIQSIEDAAQSLFASINVASTPYGFLNDALSFGLNKDTLHKSWLQNSLFFRALEEGISEEGLRFLLSLGHNVSIRDSKTQQNGLHYALYNKYPLKVLKLLVSSLEPQEQYTLLNALDHQGLSPLDQAMEQSDKESFCHLRELGAISCSPTLALKFYKRRVISNPNLHQAFKDLMALNGGVEWLVSLEELLPPLISKKEYKGTTLTSSTYGERQLPKDIKDQIFDQKGEFKRVPTQGNHPVAYAKKEGPLKTHGFYFKAYPALPGLEEAAGSFTRHLLNYGAPYTDLVKLKGAPCLISQEIPGETIQKVLETKPHLLNDLDDEDISGLMIAAMLINPEDGKPDNYIVTPHPIKQNKYRIIGIDNDQAFVPAIVKETPDKSITGKIRPIAQVKTILYCLDQMKNPIDPNIRAKIINLHPDRFLENWLRALKRINNQHCGLFTGSEQIQAFEQHKCFIGVPFQQGSIRHIYEKFVHLRDLLADNPALTHIELLNKLEPRLAKRYQAALNKNISVKERFGQVDRPFYEVKTDIRKGESHTTVTQSGDILQSMGIPLQEKIFDSIRLGKEKGPLQALEELERIKREKNEETLKSLSLRVGDINLLKTLKLEESRVLFLKELDKQKKILTPQEQIAILEYLIQQKGIRELPLPNFSVLDDTLFQKIPFEHLKKVDLRKCSKITNKSLIQLSKAALGLEELNLSYNSQLREIGDIGTFTDALLFFKELRFLNLENCTKLSKLLIQVPKLHYLNIENCSQLNDQMLDGVIEYSENLQKLVIIGCSLITEKEVREKAPNFPASCLKNVDKDPIYKILESKGSELKFRYYEIHSSSKGLMAFGKALKINAQLSNLTSLDLRGNYIQETGVKALAQGNLTSLTSLNLSSNKIGDEGVKALGRGNLTGLTWLELKDNNIGDEGAKAVANGNLLVLTSLVLSYNKIGEEGARALGTGNLTGLTSLVLSHNKIEEEGARALGTGNLTGLTSLDLSWNHLGHEGAKAIGLGNLSGLTKLDLSENNIGDDGARALANGNLTALTSLNLSSNLIGNEGIKALASSNLTNLTKLNLWGNKIGAEGAEALASSNLTGLTKLDLSYNEIWDKGAQGLANDNLTNLTSLKLEWNRIGDEGALALSTSNLKGLTSLNLRCNYIQETGVKALANGNLITLTKLNLGANEIGDEGIKALGAGNLTSLTSLDLRGNNIGEGGVKALANGNLLVLKELGLYYNNIGDEGAKALRQGNLTGLTWLNLGSNKIGYETQKVLKEKFGSKVSF